MFIYTVASPTQGLLLHPGARIKKTEQIAVLLLLGTNVHLTLTAKWIPCAPKLWPVHHWDVPDLRCTHLDLILVQPIKPLDSAPQPVKHQKRMCKSQVKCRKPLYQCFGCLIDLQPWNLCKTVDKPQPAGQALKILHFHPKSKKVLREIHGIWCDPLKILGDPLQERK